MHEYACRKLFRLVKEAAGGEANVRYNRKERLLTINFQQLVKVEAACCEEACPALASGLRLRSASQSRWLRGGVPGLDRSVAAAGEEPSENDSEGTCSVGSARRLFLINECAPSRTT